MQPKLKSKVRCSDREVGEVTRVIMDPLSLDVSHIVVGGNGVPERQVPAGAIQAVTGDSVQLGVPSGEFNKFPPFNRTEYITTHEVEIAHLEDNLHVEPGEVLVPLPVLERDVKRRTFFTSMTRCTGVTWALRY